jgi:hypothetical protein
MTTFHYFLIALALMPFGALFALSLCRAVGQPMPKPPEAGNVAGDATPLTTTAEAAPDALPHCIGWVSGIGPCPNPAKWVSPFGNPYCDEHRRNADRDWGREACRPIALPMKSVCGWCKTVLREGTEPATHGICPKCEANYIREVNGE